MAIEFPASPSDADQFVANNVTYIYDGTLGVWNIYSGTTYNGQGGGGGGASVTISDSAPASPSSGDMWWESDTGRLKIYYDDGVGVAQWVDASPSSNTVGGSNNIIAPVAIALINNTSGTGTGLTWSNWNSGAGTMDITFDNAQPDTDYAVVTDGEFSDDGRLVSVANKTTSGFQLSLYDSNGNATTPSSLNIFTVMIYGSDPTQLVATNAYSDGNVDTHLNVSGATTGEVLSWTGTDYDWVTGGSGGGASVTTSDSAPSNPSEGDLWYDTTELTTYVYYNDGDSSQWVNASPNGMSASINVSDTAPSSPADGDLWFDSTSLKTFIYYNDGSSSQWVTLVPAATSSSGATTYADTATMLQETPSAGSFGYVTANSNLYLYNGTAWGKVQIDNVAPVINSVQDGSANTTPFSFATDGTAKIITVDATDAEGFPLTYTYSVSSGTLGTTATVTQGTGAQANEFTLTPGTNDPTDAGTFDLTFTVNDGYASVDSTASFTLSFVTSHDNARAFASAGVTSNGLSDTMDYWSTAVPHTGSTVFGNLSTTSYRQGALADGPGGRGCIFAGGWNPVVDTIQYITVATPGNAQAFGTITNGSKTLAGGCSDYTYGLILAGGLGSSSNGTQVDLKVMDRFTVQTLGNTTDHGDMVNNHTTSQSATSPAGSSRGVVTGSWGGIVMEYFDIATPGNAAVFGNTTGDSLTHNAGMSDATYAVFGPDEIGSGVGVSVDLEYITVDTTGNSSSFGSLTHARYYCAGTDNLTYGFIVGGENSGVDSHIEQIETITIATPGNASSFGDLTTGRQAAAAAAA